VGIILCEWHQFFGAETFRLRDPGTYQRGGKRNRGLGLQKENEGQLENFGNGKKAWFFFERVGWAQVTGGCRGRGKRGYIQKGAKGSGKLKKK